MDHLTTAAILETPPIPARPVAVSMDNFLASIEKRAFRMAEIALQHREDALDAVQDAMFRLARNYRNHSPEEWTPLFWSILRRRITDQYRRRKVRSIMIGWLPPSSRHRGPTTTAWEPASSDPGPAQRHADNMALLRLGEAIRSLPRRQAEAFMLRVLEGLNVAVTAQSMGCSQGSVKTHLSRARHTLRKQLEDGS